jgi:hypothetical protein
MIRRGGIVSLSVLRGFALTMLVATTACATFVLKTAPGMAHDLPDRMYGLGPGPTSREELRKAGWTFAEAHDGKEMYVLGAPVQGVSDVESQVKAGQDNLRTVQFLRLKYSRTRLATYKELLNKLLTSYGPPQRSAEAAHFDLFEPDPSSDTPRPPSFIVHRWKGPNSELVFAAGLEAPENLMSNMQYQLFLLPPDTSAPLAQP